MNYALILAAGSGMRMNHKIPKQFIELKNKPIFIHTLEKFVMCNQINKIILVTKKDWIDDAKALIKKYLKSHIENIIVIEGAESRNGSLLNGLRYLENNFKLNDNDVILTHDAVRPFINLKIIEQNIFDGTKYDAIIDTCVKEIDTIVYSQNKLDIDSIPNRDQIFAGQTPQTGKYKLLKQIYNKQYDDYIFNSTDLCKLAELSNIKLRITEGDYFNIKITTEFDLYLAKLIVGKNE